MLEPDLDISLEKPIFLKIEDGLLICRNIFDGELLFYSVNGSLYNIYAAKRTFKSGCFMYWHIELRDNENGNTYVICFPYTNALFRSIVLRLSTADDFSDIRIEPYPGNANSYCRTMHSKVKVYSGYVELRELAVSLPKIICTKYGNRVKKDYSQRITVIEMLVATILFRLRKFQRARMAGGTENFLRNCR